MNVIKRFFVLLIFMGILLGVNGIYTENVFATEVTGVDFEGKEEFDNIIHDAFFLEMYGITINSYLEKTTTGYRAVLVNDKVHVLDFDQSWKKTSEKTIEFELKMYGGYYAGANNNYLVFGQPGNTDGTEIYRIVIYDKEFNRLNAVSIPYESCYTSMPFDAGNVSIAEHGDCLVVYTSRERPDGHQSNIALKIDMTNLAVESDGMADYPTIHVSHSFRQIVRFDGEQVVYADMGDGYPRAVCINDGVCQAIMLPIEGEIGNNITKTDLSGLAVSDTGYIVVGSQIRNGMSNIYLSYVDKGKTEGLVTWMTMADFSNCQRVENSKIVSIGNNQFVVMWNNITKRCVDYVIVNGNGAPLGAVKSMPGAEITQCEPVYENGQIIWYKFADEVMTVYTLADFSYSGTFDPQSTFVKAGTVWNGTADTSWYNGNVTEFALTTPEQLAGLATLVNNGNSFNGKKITLASDMFFNADKELKQIWTPIAQISAGTEFDGTFDGNGHTLYNLYSDEEYGGLFGKIGENGVVKAIRISQGYIDGDGGIASQNYGWILFCENNSFVNNIKEENAGGICNDNYGLIYGCENSGIVLDGAGIAGANRTAGATIDSCWNTGYVAGSGFSVGGIVADNYGYVLDCYNAGTISGKLLANAAKKVCGIVGENFNEKTAAVKNCYHIGQLDIDDELVAFWSDTIAASAVNSYSVPSKYNKSATEMTMGQFKSKEMVALLQDNNVIAKWCEDVNGLNGGAPIPVAQIDKENGVYKILPDIWGAETEKEIKVEDGTIRLCPYEYAFYGSEEGSAVYSSDSDIISITQDGKITPKKAGTAIVKVTFPETEHKKEVSFNVNVNVKGAEIYKIIYNLKGGKNNKKNPDSYTKLTKTIKLKEPTRKGYTFAGWYSDSKYKNKITMIKKGSTGKKKLYAKWNANKYNIKFNANGAKGSMALMKNCSYGKTYKLKKNSFKKKGYVFVGWNTKKDGSGKSYKNKGKVKNLTSKSKKTVVLYAQWEKKYKITYDLNGGRNHKNNPATYHKSSETITLKKPVRKGYIFKGWYKDSKFKKKITKIKKGTTGNIKLYAKWKKQSL